MVPLSAFAHFETGNTALAVNHQGQFPSSPFLQPGARRVAGAGGARHSRKRNATMGLPASIHASFSGTAAAFQDSLQDQPS